MKVTDDAANISVVPNAQENDTLHDCTRPARYSDGVHVHRCAGICFIGVLELGHEATLPRCSMPAQWAGTPTSTVGNGSTQGPAVLGDDKPPCKRL